MAAAGTLLQDLDGSSGGDGDLVQKILADMNIPTGGGARPIPPAMPAATPMQHQQMANEMSMDSQIPSSHMIGNAHPTPADFAAAMTGMASARPSEAMLSGSPLVAMSGVSAQPTTYEAPTKNIYSRVLDEVKVPFVVALLFVLFSLPPVRILMAHYVPRFIKQTGEFNMMGLVFVAALNGLTFWVLQRVIAPLLSL